MLSSPATILIVFLLALASHNSYARQIFLVRALFSNAFIFSLQEAFNLDLV